MTSPIAFLAFVFIAGSAFSAAAMAQQPSGGTIRGVVVDDRDVPIPFPRVTAQGRPGTPPLITNGDPDGGFTIVNASAGSYTVTATRLGFREDSVVVAVQGGRVASVRIRLAPVASRLAGVASTSTGTQIERGSTEVPQRLNETEINLIPAGRDAASVIAVLPGVQKNQMWGGAGALANNFQLDGIAMNHPGVGGDFLQPSIDWASAVEVRGLGAGAEYGDFQGGIVNVVTKSGTNTRLGSLRFNDESPKLTASNFNLNEDGQEQAGRREVSGELGGPLIRDRLFYFVGGQVVDVATRYPNLAGTTPGPFIPFQTTEHDRRGIGKLTYTSPTVGRLDGLISVMYTGTNGFGLTGRDGAAAGQVVSAPTTMMEGTWSRALSASQAIDVRVGGYIASETRTGVAGANVPGIQLSGFDDGSFQNAAFDQHLDPRSLNGRATWTLAGVFAGVAHTVKLGTDVGLGGWREEDTRNGGMTWRPVLAESNAGSKRDPTLVSSWIVDGSDWGGETHLRANSTSAALFAEDAMTWKDRPTLTAGLRGSRWTGSLTPDSAPRFQAVSATGVDPRVGIVIDPTGANALVFKVSWGRYHQGMAGSLYDRVAGGDVYTNIRTYSDAPSFTNAQTAFPASAFADRSYTETILDQQGPVDHYRQPYVDQFVVDIEKTLTSHFKLEIGYTQRDNQDLVGLQDLNLATNYTRAPQCNRHAGIQHPGGAGSTWSAAGSAGAVRVES